MVFHVSDICGVHAHYGSDCGEGKEDDGYDRECEDGSFLPVFVGVDFLQGGVGEVLEPFVHFFQIAHFVVDEVEGVVDEDAEDAVRLYRRLLSESGGDVEIVEVGFLQVFADLLLSGPDDISPETGLSLVKNKVKKVWVMAGKWDEEGGREHNFCNNSRSRKGGEVFCRLCPVPVTFLGFEIGIKVVSGTELSHSDFLYKAFLDHGSEKGRYSWDPLTALMALSGDEEKAGYDTVTGTARLDKETGGNYFTENENGLHKYVKMKFSPDYYADMINALIN